MVGFEVPFTYHHWRWLREPPKRRGKIYALNRLRPDTYVGVYQKHQKSEVPHCVKSRVFFGVT